jgi:drug/metabolite transporter (DMT)-like permease
MILIIQPFKTESGEMTGEDVAKFKFEIIGVVFSLLGAICGALSVIYNRRASSSVHFTTVAFWYAVMNTVLCPVWSIVDQRTSFPDYNAKLIGLIFAISFCFWLM